MSVDGETLKEQTEKDFCYYEVKPGDSLASIAAHFGYMTPTQLGRVNSLPFIGCSLPHVFPGQKLIIPTVTKCPIAPQKLRRAPGTALRVQSTSPTAIVGQKSIANFRFEDIYSVNQHWQQKQQRGVDETDDTNVCRFVKIPVKRVLLHDPSNQEDTATSVVDLFDGILIITPDLVCFDSTMDPPQRRGSSDLQPIGDPKPGDRPTVSSPSPNISLPLSEIVSMTTLRSLQTVYKQPPQRPSASSPTDYPSASAPVDRLVSRSPDDSIGQFDFGPECSSGQGRQSSEPTSPAFSNGQVTRREHSVTGADSPASPPTRDSCVVLEASGGRDFNADNRGDPPDPNAAHLSPPLKQVYLQLGVLKPRKADSPRNYFFEISVNNIASVHAFLLQAGVGTRQLGGHAKPIETDGQAQKQLRQSPRGSSSDDASSPSPKGSEPGQSQSLVEQLLQSVDETSPMPMLFGGKSAILTEDMLLDLGQNMPVHLTGCDLSLVFSTEVNGYSLATLYRMSGTVTRAVLLVIRDTMGTVFGAIMSERMHCSHLFYGTGESCVFHWSPNFKRYDWTKKNYHLMHGSPNGFHIGGQSGRNAIWFDESLNYGRSEPTETFDNPVLSSRLDVDFHSSQAGEQEGAGTGADSQVPPVTEGVPFIIDNLEVWEFVS